MNSLQLKISISGTSASGKSALAEKIAQVLRAADITVDVIDDNGIGVIEEHPGIIAGSLNERLHTIAIKETSVTIRTYLDKRQSF